MGFVEAVKSAFKNYVKFDGRATRQEFWWYYLFQIIALIIPSIIMVNENTASLGGMLFMLVALALILPGLGLTFRRLHDTNRSAWWLLIGFIPFGGIVLLVFYCMPGTPGPNKYGAGPFTTQVANTFQ